MVVDDYLSSWNPIASTRLRDVKIEDDSLRDGLQGAFVRRPSVEEKQALLRLAAAVGVQAAMLGFPAASSHEHRQCERLVAFIEAERLPIVPRFLARATLDDVAPIIELNRGASRPVWADYFIGCSPLRRHIEGWDLDRILAAMQSTGELLRKHETPFGVSLEDASRTPPELLERLLATALASGAQVVTLCDTVGDCTPDGARRLTQFVRERVDAEHPDVEIWWHGHDDRGLALANALVAAQAGADAISGSFLGIGERSGNTALEQVVVELVRAGHPGYCLDALLPYCEALAEATHSPIPAHAPLVGRQAFATSTGTHAAAILKARVLGPEFEDYVFSSVSARALGRRQVLEVGPNSGLASARHALADLGIEASEANARRLLDAAKVSEATLSPAAIRSLYDAPLAPDTR